MLTPFDIRFARELKTNIEEELADFRIKIASAKDYAEVQYQIGYFQALEDLIAEVDAIEHRITLEQ
jgi:hypothetical protein